MKEFERCLADILLEEKRLFVQHGEICDDISRKLDELKEGIDDSERVRLEIGQLYSDKEIAHKQLKMVRAEMSCYIQEVLKNAG